MQGERLGDHGDNRVMGELGGQGVEHVCTYMGFPWCISAPTRKKVTKETSFYYVDHLVALCNSRSHFCELEEHVTIPLSWTSWTAVSNDLFCENSVGEIERKVS